MAELEAPDPCHRDTKSITIHRPIPFVRNPENSYEVLAPQVNMKQATSIPVEKFMSLTCHRFSLKLSAIGLGGGAGVGGKLTAPGCFMGKES